MKRRGIVIRYTTPEHISRWITTFCFILTTANGLGSLFPSFNQLIQIMGTPQLACILYPFVDMVMFTSFIIMFFRYWHHSLINRDDIFWAENVRKTIINEEMGNTGRYDFGQKYAFWAVIIFLVLSLVSNAIIWRPYFAPTLSIPMTRSALMLHSFAAVALIVIIVVYIYATLWMKGTVTAMVEGWATSARARKHHPRWYREVRKITEKKAG